MDLDLDLSPDEDVVDIEVEPDDESDWLKVDDGSEPEPEGDTGDEEEDWLIKQ